MFILVVFIILTKIEFVLAGDDSAYSSEDHLELLKELLAADGIIYELQENILLKLWKILIKSKQTSMPELLFLLGTPDDELSEYLQQRKEILSLGIYSKLYEEENNVFKLKKII